MSSRRLFQSRGDAAENVLATAILFFNREDTCRGKTMGKSIDY